MRHLLSFLVYCLLSACSFAPPFELPEMMIPDNYKEAGPWVEIKPGLCELPANQAFWTMFHDPMLDELEEQLTCDNNHLKAAFARFEEAKGMAEVAASALFPDIEGIGTIARQKTSRALDPSPTDSLTNNTFLFAAILTYELDAWGRVRNSVLAGDSLAKASAFDLATLSLSMHAELASDYFKLRGLDKAQEVLDRTVCAYQRSLDLTRQRHKGGMVPEADVDEAIGQLENAKTQALKNRLKREQLDHAIAVLIGEIPGNFNLNPDKKPFCIVSVAPDLPSTLLTHRPDIAAASERICAANAKIGVARAAFFPQFNLFNLLGVESNRLSDLFSRESLLWSLGPSTALSLIEPQITQVIFDGFKRRGLLNIAKSTYYEMVNQYRQTVLEAFQEVEDSLTAIHRLDQAIDTQTKGTNAAKRALYQANQQYRGGLVTYIEVVVYENTALQSELALIDIQTRRQLAGVQLVKALGGGWVEP